MLFQKLRSFNCVLLTFTVNGLVLLLLGRNFSCQYSCFAKFYDRTTNFQDHA